MPHSNQNLVPEVITDRNGKHTTVHRRPSSAVTKQLILPVPAPNLREPVSSAPALRSALFRDPLTSEQETAYNNIFSFHPELEALSLRLLSTGTATGQRLVRETLVSAVDELAAAHKRSGVPATPSRTYGLLHGKVIRLWSYGNVREEADLSPDEISDDDVQTLNYFHNMYTAEHTPYDEIPEEEHRTMSTAVGRYWRGLSALSLAIVDPETFRDEVWDHSVSFVYWAEGHEDIGKVIRTAAQRETINPSELQQIMEATAAGVPNSLTDGWI